MKEKIIKILLFSIPLIKVGQNHKFILVLLCELALNFLFWNYLFPIKLGSCGRCINAFLTTLSLFIFFILCNYIVDSHIYTGAFFIYFISKCISLKICGRVNKSKNFFVRIWFGFVTFPCSFLCEFILNFSCFIKIIIIFRLNNEDPVISRLISLLSLRELDFIRGYTATKFFIEMEFIKLLFLPLSKLEFDIKMIYYIFPVIFTPSLSIKQLIFNVTFIIIYFILFYELETIQKNTFILIVFTISMLYYWGINSENTDTVEGDDDDSRKRKNIFYWICELYPYLIFIGIFLSSVISN